MFKLGNFISHAGESLDWKIECDSLTDEDWKAIAHVVGTRCGFNRVIGIPRGGLKFAEALQPYCDPTEPWTLLVDDVHTTGKSMKEEMAKIKGKCYGVVLFSRSERPLPEEILSVFQLRL